jgi:hypothetical protein
MTTLDRATVLTLVRDRADRYLTLAAERRLEKRPHAAEDARRLEAKATVLIELHYDLASLDSQE